MSEPPMGFGERVAAGAVAVGVLLAVAASVLGGVVPLREGAVPGLLYLLALALPAIGGALVVGAAWYGLTTRPETASPLGIDPPETGASRSLDPVGHELERSLTAAASGRYRCEENRFAAEVREHLVDGAVRAVATSRGLDREEARDAVRRGTWTEDPVAAAFLAEAPSYPLVEWIAGAVDPGAAYRRRVHRTLDAIRAVEADGGSSEQPAGGAP